MSLCKQSRRLLRLKKKAWVMLSCFAIMSFAANAELVIDKTGRDTEKAFYLGLDVGASFLSPEGESNNWLEDDEPSLAYGLLLGYQFSPKWFGEINYKDLGDADLTHRNPLIDSTFPDAAITYKALSLSAGYNVIKKTTYRVAVQLGLSHIQNTEVNANGSINFGKDMGVSSFAGLGLHYQAVDSPWSFGLTLESHADDALYSGLKLTKRFGRSDANYNDTGHNNTAENNAPITPIVNQQTVKSNQADLPTCTKTSAKLRVNFAFDQHSLTARSQALLNQWLLAHTSRTIIEMMVEGHTDSVGSAAYNHTLSKQRASEVARYLTKSMGSDTPSIRLLAEGENQPIADNANAEGRSQNRRAEVYMTYQSLCAQ